MKLRSSRVLKRAIPEIDPVIEKEDTLGNCDKNLEMGMKEIGNSNEKGLFLGSEVLDPVKDSGVSCLKGEIEEVNVKLDCGRAECSNDGIGEEGNGSVFVDISEAGSVLKEEVKSANVDSVIFADDKETLLNDSEKEDVKSPNVDSLTFADDKETLANDLEKVDVIGKRKRQKRKVINQENNDNVSGVDGDGGECSVIPRKGKRERKRKNVEGFEYNGDRIVKKEKVGKIVLPSSRWALHSRNTTIVSGGANVVDGEFGGTDLGLKRADESIMSENVKPMKKIERRGRPRKIQDENPRPKKIERRGRPRKIQDENPRPKKKQKRRGRPPKIQSEVKSSPLVLRRGRGRPRKTVSNDIIPIGPKRSRGRPRKVQGKEGIQKNRLKDMIVKKFKRRGRPLKSEAKTLATHVLKIRNMKLMAFKNTPKVQKIQKVQEDEEKSASLEGRKLKQKLLREKIVDMLLKSGWTINRRQRQDRAYKDAVYVEPHARRTHWSVTKAYAMLKKKIEKGEADSNEISAFVEIPEQEMSILFKHVDVELGYKKKKNRIGKNAKKGKIVPEKKKKFGKKTKGRNNITTKGRKPRLLARSDNGSNQDNEGGLVVKKRNLLSWMIDSEVILAGWKVQNGKTRRQKKSSVGTISDDGICCSCCNEVMGLSEFVSHCGGNTGQVFDNICFDSGISLRKCLMDSWRKEESNIIRFNDVVEGEDPNDDTCNICGDGGDLVCCDGCPSTFHQSCLDIQNFPSGDWNCIYCLCKFCGLISATTPQVEDSHEKNMSKTLSCRLCEEKFHQSCLQDAEDVNIDSNGPPFCGTKCREIYERLQTYIGVKTELEDGFSWTLLQRFDVDQDLTVDENQLKVEHNSKLAVAFSVMDECFIPIVDGRSGTNIIRNVVYNCGSNFRRLNYSGFVTAVLEKGDELISTASIRIHGYQLAEMPFIGTRHMYRRQGMCRRLLDAIESTLASIGVEKLIIPAIPELLETWTTAFGFMLLEESKRKVMKSVNMLVFPRIDMLEKPLRLYSSGKEKDANNEQSDDPTVVKDVITDYQQTEEETVITDRCSGPHLGNNKLIICDLNFPVKNAVQSDTDGQTSVDSGSFQDCIAGPSSMDSTSVENHQSPSTSKLVPKNMFDLNLHPSVAETDMNTVSDDFQVCAKSFELSDSSGAGQPDSKPCESQPLDML